MEKSRLNQLPLATASILGQPPSILCVGVATLDIVSELSCWPGEDTEIRALDLRQVRGGNAANTAVVLAGLGGQAVDWMGTLGDDPGAARIVDDLRAGGVGIEHAVTVSGGVTPTSCVWLNRRRATRTIVHYRDLPELDASYFSRVDLAPYAWIHFEGRNVPVLAEMLRRARDAGARVSLEIEKPREHIESLWPLADVLLFSRHYALEKGFDSPRALLRHAARQAPRAALFCAWGEEGAAWQGVDGDSGFVGATPLARCVDTLGAGDVFNAAVVHGLLRGRAPREVIGFACRLAGRKCAQIGFEGLRDE